MLTGFFWACCPSSLLPRCPFDGIRTVLNRAMKSNFSAMERSSRANDVLELIQVVAGGRDGPLCAQVGPHDRQNLAVTSTLASQVGQYTPPMRRNIGRFFEECDDARTTSILREFVLTIVRFVQSSSKRPLGRNLTRLAPVAGHDPHP